MIVAMQPEASEGQINHICDRIREFGYTPHIIKGTERTVIAAVGPGDKKEHIEHLKSADGVEDAFPILQPFKLVSKEVKKQKSVVRIGDVAIGDGGFVVMAGPCSVEGREQLRLAPAAGLDDAHPGIHAQHQARIACASGADRFKVEMQLRKTGLMDYFEGRIFSGYETARSKPHPDVYLAAADALQVDPRRCAVVEDSLTGVAAGVAAGAVVFAYLPHGDAAALRQAGAAHVFTDMAELPHYFI